MSPTSAPALAVVVPVHNETENLAPLIGEIHVALEGGIDFEIVYVDDGSSDETPRLLAALAAKHPKLRVFRHVNNCGQSTAVRTGVRQALAPLVATLDGDGPRSPRPSQQIRAGRPWNWNRGSQAAKSPRIRASGFLWQDLIHLCSRGA